MPTQIIELELRSSLKNVSSGEVMIEMLVLPKFGRMATSRI